MLPAFANFHLQPGQTVSYPGHFVGINVDSRQLINFLHKSQLSYTTYSDISIAPSHEIIIVCLIASDTYNGYLNFNPTYHFMSFFITFEGIEGSGKTTQLLLLLKYLQALGYSTVATREPGGCPISNAIRTLLLDPENVKMASRTELLLYSAARAQHVVEFIQPSLAAGAIVLCDRFSDATTVYQGAGRGLNMQQLKAIDSFASDGLVPDLTLLLDYPAEAGLQRARARNHSGNLESEGRFELEALAFHQRIRQGYLDLAEREERVHIIDALGDEEMVAKRINSVVDSFLASRRSA